MALCYKIVKDSLNENKKPNKKPKPMERTGKFNSIIGKPFCITKESMTARKSKAKLRKDVKCRANIG